MAQHQNGSRTAADLQPSEVTTLEEWKEALSVLKNRAGLSVRDLARATGGSSSTIGGYLSGRNLPTPANHELLLSILDALGVKPASRQDWLDLVGRLRQLPGPRPLEATSPYKGLAGYQVGDAEVFCGREAITERLSAQVLTTHSELIVLVGASGSGKSSLLQAGLAADLQERGWAWLSVTPGANPLAMLRRMQLAWKEAQASDQPLLLMADQFEELWTQGSDERVRREVVTQLRDLARDPQVAVVIGLRADFYGHALRDPELARSLQDHQFVLGPMSQAELTRAVTEPAARSGLHLEPGLVELLVSDLAIPVSRPGAAESGQDAGVLPLLSFALLQTWKRSARNRMSVADYRASGGVAGAVAAAAEQAYSVLTPEQAELARRIFLRLTVVSDEAADTRRRVEHRELDALNRDLPGAAGAVGVGADAIGAAGVPAPEHPADVAEVIEGFVQARLLTMGETTVEMAHEALLTAWPRLQQWLDDDRGGLLLEQLVRRTTREWADAQRDPTVLFKGARLAAVREWIAQPDHRERLTILEQEFVDASIQAADQAVILRRRRLRRLQLLAGSLVVALVAAAGLAGAAWKISRTAERDRDQALSRELAEAATRLRGVDPAVAAQLALAGYRRAPSTQARSALMDSTALPLPRRITGPGGLPAVAIGGQGRLLAAAGDSSNVQLWRLKGADQAPEPLVTLKAVQKLPLYAVALNLAGTRLAAAGSGGDLHVWDITAPAAPVKLPVVAAPESGILSMVFSPDGSILAVTVAETGVGKTAGRVELWDVRGLVPVRLPGSPLGPTPKGLQAVAFSPDGAVLAAAGESGQVYRWQLSAGQAPKPLPVLSGPTNTATSLAFSPDGGTLVAGCKDQNLYLWKGGATTATVVTGARSWVNAVAFSSSGDVLAAGSSDSHLRLYDTTTMGLVADVGGPGPVTGAAFSPDGSQLFTGASDGLIRQWSVPLPMASLPLGRAFGLTYLGQHNLLSVTAKNALRTFTSPRDLSLAPGPMLQAPGTGGDVRFSGTMAYSRDAGLVVAGGAQGSSWLYRVTPEGSVTPAGSLPKQQTTLVEAAAFAGKGRYLFTGDDDQTLQITDVSDPMAPVAVGKPLMLTGVAYSMAASPDGRLLAIGVGTSGALQLWDVADVAHPHQMGAPPDKGSPTQQVYGLAFTPDGRRVIVGSADGSLKVLDVSQPSRPAWLGRGAADAGAYLYSVAASADGRRVASASGDGRIRTYALADSGSLSLESTLMAAGDVPMYSVALSPDGQQIAGGGTPEVVYAWTLDPGKAARQVCERAGLKISRVEWARYVPGAPYTAPC